MKANLVLLFTIYYLFLGHAETAKPNIIFILADDLGWHELGCYGNNFNETQHLDQLAKDGIRFTQAYAAAPVCSPYRAALLTGQYPARVGILDYLRPGDKALSTEHITLAESLKSAGYSTGMIGKWHLTGYKYHGAKEEIRAIDHGFDEELVSEIKGVGNGANFYPYVFRKQPISWTNVKKQRISGHEFLVDRMNLEAVDFIERNKEKPFFLYLSHFAPHSIVHGKPELVDKYKKKHPPGKSGRDKCYLCQDAGLTKDAGHHWAKDHNPHLAAMLESIDDGIGLIRKKLSETGLDQNTLIIFTSDNGGESNITTNGPLKGGKSTLYEGGIRVPLIMHWPNQIKPGSISSHPTVNIDFYPTLCELTNITPNKMQHLDGQSIVPILKNPEVKLPERTFMWHYPLDKPHFLGGRSSGSIRHGDWKLIEYFENGKRELYHLEHDFEEKVNLASKHPEKVQDLQKQLSDWRKEVNAKVPPGQIAQN